MPAPLRCPRCSKRMTSPEEGVYQCPNGHRWLDDSPDAHQPEDWVPDGISLSYVPGSHHGGSSSNRGKGPAKAKMEAWVRKEMPGIHIRQAPRK